LKTHRYIIQPPPSLSTYPSLSQPHHTPPSCFSYVTPLTFSVRLYFTAPPLTSPHVPPPYPPPPLLPTGKRARTRRRRASFSSPPTST
jgi:hypothetical protein